MPDKHYDSRKLAQIYDIDSPWSVDRDFYLALAGAPPKSILDFGCGTGLLCDAYAAKGHQVTGVDPSSAMLEVARQKPQGKKIEWVQSPAQTYNSNKRYDLIIMTGHAFQVLLDDRDITATFEVMRKHLEPNGLIVFESRNPTIDWSKTWNYSIILKLPNGTVRESRAFREVVGDRMKFDLTYEFADETLVSSSELRFLSRNEIGEALIASGLVIEKVLGDWESTPFDEAVSHEMIFFVKSAK